jgi:hypothetical protein
MCANPLLPESPVPVSRNSIIVIVESIHRRQIQPVSKAGNADVAGSTGYGLNKSP